MRKLLSPPLLVALICILIIGMASPIVFMSQNNTPAANNASTQQEAQSTGNPEEVIIEGIEPISYTLYRREADNSLTTHVVTRVNDMNGTHYEFLLEDAEGLVGTQVETEDYVFTYGYRYTGTTAASINNGLTGWTKDIDIEGWGVRVKDLNKSTYQDVPSTILDLPVVNMDRTFFGCSKMTSLPALSGRTVSTAYMCRGCTSLAEIELPHGLKTISTYTFQNCTGIKAMYITSNVYNIGAYAFSGCTNLTLFIARDETALPSTWDATWNNSVKKVYDQFSATDYASLKNDGYIIKDGETITFPS